MTDSLTSAPESRAAATNRLYREGRWEEASTYRDSVRRELRSQKVPRAEANDQAWAAMIEKFPPLAVPVQEHVAVADPSIEDEAIDFAALLERTKGIPPDLDRDALWAYEQLDVITATPDAAPSLGAWGLLKWARGNRNRFFEQVLPKVAASKKKRDEERKRSFVDDDDVVEDRGIEELSKMIRKHLLRHAELFIANSPKFIEHEVRSTLNGWLQRMGITPAADEMTDLIRDLIAMTGRCVEAALARPGEYKRNNVAFREEVSCAKRS